MEFLHTLALLDEPRPPDGAAPATEVPELRAARGLFRWDVRSHRVLLLNPGKHYSDRPSGATVGRDKQLYCSLARAFQRKTYRVFCFSWQESVLDAHAGWLDAMGRIAALLGSLCCTADITCYFV